MTTAPDLAPRVLPDVCDEHNCREATTHPITCRCSCQGAGHGVRARVLGARAAAAFRARSDVRPDGLTSAMLAGPDPDEEW